MGDKSFADEPQKKYLVTYCLYVRCKSWFSAVNVRTCRRKYRSHSHRGPHRQDKFNYLINCVGVQKTMKEKRDAATKTRPRRHSKSRTQLTEPRALANWRTTNTSTLTNRPDCPLRKRGLHDSRNLHHQRTTPQSPWNVTTTVRAKYILVPSGLRWVY